MKAIGLLFTGAVLLATNFQGAESASTDLFEGKYLEERNLSMRYLRDRNLSMRYLVEGRHLSMRYLVAGDKSDAWGRSLTDAEKAKIEPIMEEGLFWDKRMLSLRYLQQQKGGKARRLRVSGEGSI